MEGLSEIVKGVARAFAGFILTFGMYIVLYGHLTPGGGFAGGVIMAGGFVLLVLAYGKSEGAFGLDRASEFWEPFGAFIFLLIACAGLTVGIFFKNFLLAAGKEQFTIVSGGSVLLSNLAIGLKVWMGVVAVFLGLVMFRRARPEE